MQRGVLTVLIDINKATTYDSVHLQPDIFLFNEEREQKFLLLCNDYLLLPLTVFLNFFHKRKYFLPIFSFYLLPSPYPLTAVKPKILLNLIKQPLSRLPICRFRLLHLRICIQRLFMISL